MHTRPPWVSAQPPVPSPDQKGGAEKAQGWRVTDSRGTAPFTPSIHLQDADVTHESLCPVLRKNTRKKIPREKTAFEFKVSVQFLTR